MDALNDERVGPGDWGSVADRTPPTSRARPAVTRTPATPPAPWPEGVALPPPPGLWGRLEAQLRDEGIIR